MSLAIIARISNSALTFSLAAGVALILGYYAVHTHWLAVLLVIILATAITLLKHWNNLFLLIILIGSIVSFSPFSLSGTVFLTEYLLIFFFAWVSLTTRARLISPIKTAKFSWILFLMIVLVNFLRNPKFPQIMGGDPRADGVGFAYFLHGLTLICGFLLGPVIFRNKEQLQRFLGGLAVLLVIALGFAWANYLWGFSSIFVPGYGGKVFVGSSDFGTVTRFGWIGTYAIYLLPLALAFLPDRRWLIKLSSILVLLVSIIISGGRIELIAFAIVLAVYLYLRSHKFGLAILVTTSFAILYLVIFTLGINNVFPELNCFTLGFTTSQFEQTLNGYSTSRLGVYQASLDLIRTNPLVGIGPATDAEIQKDLTTYSNDGIAHAREGTHAAFINIATILGIPALLIYLIALVLSFFKLFRLNRQFRAPFEHNSTIFILLSLVSSATLYIASGSSTGGNLYFYIILGLVEVLAIWHSSKPGFDKAHSD